MLILYKKFKPMFYYIFSKEKDAVWHFIQGIHWLHPTVASLCTFIANEKNEYLDKASLWIYKRYVIFKSLIHVINL